MKRAPRLLFRLVWLSALALALPSRARAAASRRAAMAPPTGLPAAAPVAAALPAIQAVPALPASAVPTAAAAAALPDATLVLRGSDSLLREPVAAKLRAAMDEGALPAGFRLLVASDEPLDDAKLRALLRQKFDGSGPVDEGRWNELSSRVSFERLEAPASAAPAPPRSLLGRLKGRLSAQGPSYVNPVYRGNLPDPMIVEQDGWFYATATSNKSDDAFPIMRSRDLVRWEPRGHIFPKGARPEWAGGFFWAPEIHRVGGRWVAYYTAEQKDGKLSIGAAWATSVEGPWTDLGRPLLSNPRVGLIDSHLFQDFDGRKYLYWKEDSNALSPKEKTGLFVQQVDDDGITLLGKASRLLENDLPWEGDLIEGPWVTRRGGYYYLFYSANSFADHRYAVGVARASSPRGPFVKLGRPILRSNTAWSGPGHNALFAMPARTRLRRALEAASRWRLKQALLELLEAAWPTDFMVYHAWEGDKTAGDQPFVDGVQPGGSANSRMLLLDRVEWDGGWPRVGSGTPSAAPRPLP